MAVARAGAVAATGLAAAASSVTFAFDPDDASTIITVGTLSKTATEADRIIASVTFSGSGSAVGMDAGPTYDPAFAGWYLSAWYQASPSVSSGNVVVTNQGGGNATFIWAVAQGWSGTSGSGNFIGGSNSATAPSPSQNQTVTVTTTGTGSMVMEVAIGGVHTVNYTPHASQTEIVADAALNADDRYVATFEANASPGSVVMSGTWASNPFGWATLAWELLASPAGTITHRALMLGVGL